MASVNKVILIGRLGADPEVRETTRGAAVANMSVATSRQWVDQRNGERQRRTEWHRVVVWGRQAEMAREILAKGSAVYVEGELQSREWTDAAGNRRVTTEVRASRVHSLDRRPRSTDPESVSTEDHEAVSCEPSEPTPLP